MMNRILTATACAAALYGLGLYYLAQTMTDGLRFGATVLAVIPQ